MKTRTIDLATIGVLLLIPTLIAHGTGFGVLGSALGFAAAAFLVTAISRSRQDRKDTP